MTFTALGSTCRCSSSTSSLARAGTSADRLHDSAARAGQLLAPEHTVCSRVPKAVKPDNGS